MAPEEELAGTAFQLEEEEVYALLRYAVRYALPRRSYAAADVAGRALGLVPALAQRHRNDLLTEIRAAKMGETTFGDPESWRPLVHVLEQLEDVG